MNALRQTYIDQGLLSPTQDEPPYITPLQLPAGTKVLRIDRETIGVTPYKTPYSAWSNREWKGFRHYD